MKNSVPRLMLSGLVVGAGWLLSCSGALAQDSTMSEGEMQQLLNQMNSWNRPSPYGGSQNQGWQTPTNEEGVPQQPMSGQTPARSQGMPMTVDQAMMPPMQPSFQGMPPQNSGMAQMAPGMPPPNQGMQMQMMQPQNQGMQMPMMQPQNQGMGMPPMMPPQNQVMQMLPPQNQGMGMPMTPPQNQGMGMPMIPPQNQGMQMQMMQPPNQGMGMMPSQNQGGMGMQPLSGVPTQPLNNGMPMQQGSVAMTPGVGPKFNLSNIFGGARPGFGGIIRQMAQLNQGAGAGSQQSSSQQSAMDAIEYELSRAKTMASQAVAYMDDARSARERSSKQSAASESRYYANEARAAADRAESRAYEAPQGRSMASAARAEANRAQSAADYAADAAGGW